MKNIGYPDNLIYAIRSMYRHDDIHEYMKMHIEKSFMTLTINEMIIIDVIYKRNMTLIEASSHLKMNKSNIIRVRDNIIRKLSHPDMLEFILSEYATLDEFILSKGVHAKLSLLKLKPRTISSIYAGITKRSGNVVYIRTIEDILNFMNNHGLDQLWGLGAGSKLDILSNEYINRYINKNNSYDKYIGE